MPGEPGLATPTTQFGANAWLVDELYARFSQDKSLVDPAWWDFFEDYQPSSTRDATRRPSDQVSDQGDDADGSLSQPPGGLGAPTPFAQPSGRAPARSLYPQLVDLTATPTASVRRASAGYAEAHLDVLTDGEEAEDETLTLKGPPARAAANMVKSLAVPTATSMRSLPVKVLIENRLLINDQLARERGGRVSFTHLVAFAMAEALRDMPEMNVSFAEDESGKPQLVSHQHVSLGLAIDLAKPDGGRQLLVPGIRSAESLPFAQFWAAYDDLIRRARAGKLTVDDLTGITATLTNPGGIGTVASVPRLMPNQGVIIGVGSLDYPPEFVGASDETLTTMGISKQMTLTSTYDHRVIQGAQSGEFLRLMAAKLTGTDGFYDRVFASLKIPYRPFTWERDRAGSKADKAAQVIRLIHNHRVRGHMMADLDPLAYRQRGHRDLDLGSYGLSMWDLDRVFPTGGFGGIGSTQALSLRQILALLRQAYCRKIGLEFMHIEDPDQRQWWAEQVERDEMPLNAPVQRRILSRLGQAEALETFLQTKYVGAKRFSLEGGEVLIPVLDELISNAADQAYPDVAIGMPHRGRLNVLTNIAGKSYAQVFAEFEDNADPREVAGSGDVKYHLGTEGVYVAPSGAMTRVQLAANPSHLEAVDGVLEGIVRAKLDALQLTPRFQVLPILIHGDAAFAGQGVVMETLNMSRLRGYRVGGTIHIIVNNQIGFTTGTWNSRSTYYATDVAKGYGCPILHVNGDDPEACLRAARLAFQFRARFKCDVVIDIVGYRRRGHNEGDDPSMTQPVMYSLIEAKRSVRKLYTEALLSRGELSVKQAEEALRAFQAELERALAETRARETDGHSIGGTGGLEVPASQTEDAGLSLGWRTAVPAFLIERVGQAHLAVPAGFTVHPKLAALLQRRAKMVKDGGIDWGFGELLAFGSLLLEGTPVRLAGQDSRRGTFTQRHAVFHDRLTGDEWTPLQFLAADQARFWVYDSPLSEYAAAGFEYGYSVERPDALVVWEAQFGDFFNGAQTIMDEFIASAEQKWAQHASVVYLLPHGYEGQGPDHSSGRIERILQLCAESNLVVAQPSTPASYFHLLRRQAYARPRRPMVVFTPKSMLRHKAAVSAVGDFTAGEFCPVLPETTVDPAGVTRVLLCTGKLYWDLVARRAKLADDGTAIVRLEQLYPVDEAGIRAALNGIGAGVEVVWVQDEPDNQGAWRFLDRRIPAWLESRPWRGITRPAAASPATGSHAAHARETELLLTRAFAR